MEALGSAVMKNMRGQRSMQAQVQRMKKGELPTDLGLLPETIIRPPGKDLPRLFSSQWRRRLRIETSIFLQTPKEVARFMYLTWWQRKRDPLTNKPIKTPWYLSERYFVARDLHKRLYTAIAEGDRDTIEKIACNGLNRQVMIKLDHRKALKTPAQEWQIKYKGFTPKTEKQGTHIWLLQAFLPPSLKSTKIMSDRTTPAPLGKDGMIRQVVARIRSKQTLDKKDGTKPREVDQTEYVVIQKMRSDGKEDDWQIWGTTQPTSKQTFDEILDDVTRGSDSLWTKMKNQLYSQVGKSPTI